MNQLWFVFRGKQKLGPFSSAQLRAQVRAGELQPQDFLMLHGQNQWMIAASVKGLFPTATEAPRASASGGDPVSPKPASPLARPDAVASESPPPSGTVPRSSLLRWRPWLWVVAACCVPVVLGLIIWASSRGHKSTLQQDSLAGFASSGSDLDDLARLFSQDVFVGSKEFCRPEDAVWIEAVVKLRSSSDKAVAATVEAAKDAITARADAVSLDLKATKEIKERMEESVVKNTEELKQVILDTAIEEQISEFESATRRRHEEIDEDVKSRIDAWRRERDERGPWKAGGNFITSELQRRSTDIELRAVRRQADVWESEKFAEHVAPALRTRAGARTNASPLDLKVGKRTLGISLSSSRLAPGSQLEDMLLASGSSRYDRDLTRLTLIFELQRGDYSRFFIAYLPRLRPAESFRLHPVPCPYRGTVRGLHRPEAPPGKEFRYSAWCDQFAIEDRELPPEGYEGATLAYGVQALLGNPAFLCDPARNPIGSYAPAVAAAERSRRTGVKPPERALFGRYGLTFTEVTPEGGTWKVQARLDQYEVDGKEKIDSSVTYAGVLRPGPEKKPQATGLLKARNLVEENEQSEAEARQQREARRAQPRKTFAEREREAAQERQKAIQERKKAAQERSERADQMKLAYADLVCELDADGKKQRFDVRIQANGQLKWRALDAPLQSRFVLPAEQVKKRDQIIGNNHRLREARKLAKEGNKAEAEKALNDFIASAPGEMWEASARQILGNLDRYAEQGSTERTEEASRLIEVSYLGSVAVARKLLVSAIDENLSRLHKDSGLDRRKMSQAVGPLRNAKDRFLHKGWVPWTKELWPNTSAYLSAVAEARAKLLASYGDTPIPDNLRKLIDKREVARWIQSPGDQSIILYANGSLNDPAAGHTWSFNEGRLTFRWKDDRVDECDVAPDGLSYTGHDHTGKQISGTLVKQR